MKRGSALVMAIASGLSPVAAGDGGWLALHNSPNAAGAAGATTMTADATRSQVYVIGSESDPNHGHSQAVTIAYQA